METMLQRQKAPVAPRPDEPARILLVEDDAELRRSIREVFEMFGFEVSTSSDGVDAVERAFRGGYDAIVTDIRLPGMDGIGIAATLRQHPHPPKVFFITAYPHWKVYDDATRLQVVDVLTKPLNLVALVEIVREALRGRPW